MLDLGANKTIKMVVCLLGARSVKFCDHYFPGKARGPESYIQRCTVQRWGCHLPRPQYEGRPLVLDGPQLAPLYMGLPC